MPAPVHKRRLTAFAVAMAVLIVTPLAVVAADRFDDVPNSNIFHDDINAIAEAGVTLGCNPPANDEYCPSDNVTREQMAAFMNRLGALEPGQTPVANAATALEADHAATADDASTLEGMSAEEISSVAQANNDNDALGNSVTNAGMTEVGSLTIQAPADGFLMIMGSVFINPVTDTGYVIEPLVDGNTIVPGPDIGEAGWIGLFDPEATDISFSLSYNVTTPVTEGTHTVSQRVGPFSGTASWFMNKPHLTALFVPEGGVTTFETFGGDSALDGTGTE